MKKIITVEMQKIINEIIERQAYSDAVKRELEIIYPSLVNMAEYGLREINTPIGTWKFEEK